MKKRSTTIMRAKTGHDYVCVHEVSPTTPRKFF